MDLLAVLGLGLTIVVAVVGGVWKIQKAMDDLETRLRAEINNAMESSETRLRAEMRDIRLEMRDMEARLSTQIRTLGEDSTIIWKDMRPDALDL